MSGWWVHREYELYGAVFLFAHVFWVIASIVLHELAHGWAAIRQGDDTPIRLNRMTWNPLVHMGPFSLILFAVIGIAFGVMPVDPSRFRSRRWGELLVASAGPAMNVLLAVTLTIIGALVARATDPNAANYQTMLNLQTFFWVGAFFNVLLAVLNMLPLPPLDGSTVLGEVVPSLRTWFRHPYAPFVGLAGLWLASSSGLLMILCRPFFVAIGMLWMVVSGGVRLPW